MWVLFIVLMRWFSSLKWKILPLSPQYWGTLTRATPLFVSSKDCNFFVSLLDCFVSITILHWAEVYSSYPFHYHYLLHSYHLLYPTQSLLLSLLASILHISCTCSHRSNSHLLLDTTFVFAPNIFHSFSC